MQYIQSSHQVIGSNMKFPLSLLVADDSEDDYNLLCCEIGKGGFNIDSQRIQSEDELKTALTQKTWDIVISDLKISGFNGIRVPEIIKSLDLDIPCIIVSGLKENNPVVEAMRAGADDYIVKGNYARLVPAVKRSLKSAKARRKVKAGDRKLEESRENINALLNVTDDMVFIIKPDGTILEANESFLRYLGTDNSGAIGMPLSSFSEKGLIMHDWNHFEDVKKNMRATRFCCTIEGRYFDNTVYPVCSHDGEIQRFIILSRDVTEAKRTEEALKKSEERLSLAMNATNDALWDWNTVTNHVFCSPRFHTMLGYKNKKFEGNVSMLNNILHFNDKKYIMGYMHDIVKMKIPSFEVEYRLLTKDGRYRWILSRGKAVDFAGDGTPLRLVGTHIDITERKVFEESLAESEERFRSFVEQASEAFLLVDPEGKIVEWNKAQELLTGYSKYEVRGKYIWDVRRSLYHGTESEEKYYEEIKRSTLALLETGAAPFINRVVEVQIKNRRGETRFLEQVSFTIITSKGIKVGTTSRDVTGRYRAEEKLRNSLIEKEVLLKEIHHRVKNNMQVISSLLHLQERSIKDPHSLGIFRDSKDRIKSMALVHESLYQSKNLAGVDFDIYLRKMVENLSMTYSSEARDVVIEISADNISLPIDNAIPCGLIINELVSNAFKYAFKETGLKTLSVNIFRIKENYLVIVKDSGEGFPDGFDLAKIETLGMNLVQKLVQQLGGKFEYFNDNGAVFKFEFPAVIS